MARQCEGGHCSIRSQELNEFCKLIYGQHVDDYAGKPVVSEDANGPCYCTCSCVALGTRIATGLNTTEAVEFLSEGSSVLAAGEDLNWQVVQVDFSDGTGPDSTQNDAILVKHALGQIVVTSDHLFLVEGGKLRRADRLAPGMNLIAQDGSLVAINEPPVKGFYRGGFHYIATSRDNPNGSLDGHLIITERVVSADYTIQLYDDEFLDENEENLPIVGTKAYNNQYGLQETAPAAPFASSSSLAGMVTGEEAIQPIDVTVIRAPGQPRIRRNREVSSSSPGKFVESSLIRLRIPPGACSFIPDEEARQKSLQPMKTSLASLAAREEAEGLVYHFSAYYPDVVYHIDWYDDTVNAYAWVENGQRHVALLGGLIRFSSIEYEAIALVLGHELAHHYGGPPTYPHGLSCEGQADYIGAAVMMRRVFYGETYVSTMNAAIEQLSNFFGPRPPGWGCSHPSVECRTDIYRAAVTIDPIPNCAHAN